ncbi:hypothetical protein [Veronia pacifica]|uniref:hypothetical protein n=1 Tax=Veronia pacifica TaxID=1080227 RepID=UPI001112E019
MAVSLATLLSACGGDDSSSSVNNAVSPTDVKFNLSNAIAVVTTTKNAQTYANPLKEGNPDAPAIALQSAENTGYAGYNSSNSSNLFAMDEKGQLSPVLANNLKGKFSYSVVSPDGKYIYIAVEHDSLWESNDLIAATECAIFKVNTANNSHSCLAEGYFAEKPYNWNEEINDGRFKPIQIDGDGNVYFIGKKFKVVDEDGYKSIQDLDDINGSSTQGVITRVDSKTGQIRQLSVDSKSIQSFIVTKSNTLVYRDNSGLNMLPDSTKNSTIPLLDSNTWLNTYSVDDSNTVIYQDSNSLSFAKPSKEAAGGIDRTKITVGYNASSLIMGDNGHLYSLKLDPISPENSGLYSILPQSDLPVVRTPDLSSSWRWSTPLQIAKGRAFYVATGNHNNYGNYDTINVANLTNKETIALFGGEPTKYRLSIENWKYKGDTLYFTAFNQADSTMVSGTIDVNALSQGKPESDFLDINTTASVSNDAISIADMEIIRPQRPVNSGGNPKVVKVSTPVSNFSSSTIEFNKWMDPQSVENHISVTNTDTGEQLKPMLVWLNRMAHVIYPALNQDNNGELQGLDFASHYRLFIDGNAQDSDGFKLVSGQPDDKDRTFNWQTRPEQGPMLVNADHDESTLTTGNAVKAFDGKLTIHLFDGTLTDGETKTFSLLSSTAPRFDLDVSATNFYSPFLGFYKEADETSIYHKDSQADNEKFDAQGVSKMTIKLARDGKQYSLNLTVEDTYGSKKTYTGVSNAELGVRNLTLVYSVKHDSYRSNEVIIDDIRNEGEVIDELDFDKWNQLPRIDDNAQAPGLSFYQY